MVHPRTPSPIPGSARTTSIRRSRFPRRVRRLGTGLLAVLAVLLMVTTAALSTATPARAAVAEKLPITITNDTGRSGLYLYVLGVDLTTDKLGWVNADGVFTPWSLPGGPVPVDAPDASIPGPANGASVTVDVPRNISGRVYFSFASKLSFGLVDAGLVQPAPWNPGDDNADILFDWSEFTFNDYGLWLNSTQVDQFAVPHTVSVTGEDGATATTGALKDGGRQTIIDTVEQTKGFEKTVVRGDDGQVLRVLSPGKATGVDAMSSTYLDDYIDEAWAAYASKQLTVVPFAHEPETKFFGSTSGNELVFTDTAGKQVARFARPTTANVWDCDGALAAPNDHVVGPISRTLCAALHRGTLGESTQEPVTDASRFYQRDLTNHYSEIVHANMKDGKAYGFAFDDVTGQESLVHSGGPVKASITLGSLS
jgi:hypothetical protein